MRHKSSASAAIVIVIVDVIANVIVAEHVNGNAHVAVIAHVIERADRVA